MSKNKVFIGSIFSEEEAQLLLQKALAETNRKRAGAFFQPLESIKTQLEYLLDSLNHRNDRQRLGEITIGRYAAYEFESSDPDYANVLYEVSSVCSLMAKGRI